MFGQPLDMSGVLPSDGAVGAVDGEAGSVVEGAAGAVVGDAGSVVEVAGAVVGAGVWAEAVAVASVTAAPLIVSNDKAAPPMRIFRRIESVKGMGSTP